MFCSFHLWFVCFLICSIWPWLISLLNSFQPHEEDLSNNNGKDTSSLCCKELGTMHVFPDVLGNCSWRANKGASCLLVFVQMNTLQMLLSHAEQTLLYFIIPELLRLQGGPVQLSMLIEGFTMYSDLAEVSTYDTVLNALMLSLCSLLSIRQQPPFQKNLSCKDSWLWGPHSGGWQLKETILLLMSLLW